VHTVVGKGVLSGDGAEPSVAILKNISDPAPEKGDKILSHIKGIRHIMRGSTVNIEDGGPILDADGVK
jgi:hypothetical protein